MVTPKGKAPRPPALPDLGDDEALGELRDDATLVVRSPYETDENPNVTRLIYPTPGGPAPIGGPPTGGFRPLSGYTPGVALQPPSGYTPGGAFQPPSGYTPGGAFQPPPAYSPTAPAPAMRPSASHSGAQFAIPAAPPTAPSARSIPWWVLPYVIGCLALAAAGAGVLWLQSRFLGHF